MTEKTDLSHLRHELRNHINNISMNAELVKMQAQNGAAADQLVRSVDRILTQCQACAEFLNTLSEDS